VVRGHDVTLFAKASSLTLARLEPILSADFSYAQVTSPHAPDVRDRILDEAVTRALKLIDEDEFDVIFNNSLSPLPYTELHHRPMLTILHTPPTLRRVNAVIGRPEWRPGTAHAFAGVSQLNADSWRARLPRVESIPNGIYLQEWALGRSPEPDLAVWSARITPEKGLHLAIEAARLAGMRLEFAGPIADPEYYRTQIVPRLSDDVVYRGHADRPQLADLLGRGAVFLATPLWAEPFGLAMVEAMACGTPVAALPNGATGEVVSVHGGVIADHVSAQALAGILPVAARLDRRQVRESVRRYDVETMMDGYEQIMRALVGPGGSPFHRDQVRAENVPVLGRVGFVDVVAEVRSIPDHDVVIGDRLPR
jgi:glycosyltransferase involved in cell wall biosynthesis